MEEVIKYFESLEARIAALEARMDQIEQKQQLGADGFEQIKGIMSKMGANILGIQQFLKEAQLQKEAKEESQEPIVEPEPEVSEPVVGIEPEEPQEAKGERLEAKVEQASPKAAVYGKAVGDIRLAISLGDRFLYQRELFGQNAELMQKTLTKLNEMHSFDEALAFISKNFNWDTESNTYQQFLVTLHRRFG